MLHDSFAPDNHSAKAVSKTVAGVQQRATPKVRNGAFSGHFEGVCQSAIIAFIHAGLVRVCVVVVKCYKWFRKPLLYPFELREHGMNCAVRLCFVTQRTRFAKLSRLVRLVGQHPQNEQRSAGYLFLRVQRSCSQNTSLLPGDEKTSGTNPSLTKGGMVRPSCHFLISAWPSTNESPPAR